MGSSKIIYFITFALSLLIKSVSSDIFGDYYKKAEEILSTMTQKEKIGQIFLSRYNISIVDDYIKTYAPGGFILFANNLENHTKEELIKEIKERQSISKIPLAIGVDEEGGNVSRIGLYFRDEKFPSPRQSYLKNGIEEILSIEKEKRALLKELQFNLNLAPVADISTNESDYIYYRTLGENVNITTDYITQEVQSYYDNKFTCCLKHFPGYGNNSNTHDDVAHDYRPIEQFKKVDLVPFVKSINKKVPMIMFSHNIVHSMDEEYPASLSKKIHDMLRNDYNYTGLIVTDSLSMGAITKYTKNISAAVLAVKAGNDLLLTSTFKQHIDELIEAVDKGEVEMDLIEKAAKRVLAWKLQYLYSHGISSLNVFLIVVLIVAIFGLIGLLVFICIQYNKNEENVDRGSDSENVLLRDTTNTVGNSS